MRTTALLTLALLTLPLVAVGQVSSQVASAASTGGEVVDRLDRKGNLAKDQYFEYEVINQEKGREPTVMRLQVWVKGEARFTEFLAPGDMKGTRVLVKSRDQMYVYLPAYNKVRRVASHTTSGGFMGTTYSNDDMATSFYGPVYDLKIASQDDSSWVLSGPPREGVKAAYGSIEMTVSKELMAPTQIRYFNQKGTHIKTETRSGYSCQGEICNAESMKMVDHTRNDTYTELLRRDWKVDAGIDDGIFSVRNLQP